MVNGLDTAAAASGSVIFEEVADLVRRTDVFVRPAPPAFTAGRGELPFGAVEIRLDGGLGHADLLLGGELAMRLAGPIMHVGTFWMTNGRAGPRLEAGDRSGALRWRQHGRRTRMGGRPRSFEIALADRTWHYAGDGQLNALTRETFGASPVVHAGFGGRAPADPRMLNPPPRVRVGWAAGATHLEICLSTLVSFGMYVPNLSTLPERMIDAVL